MFLCLFPGGLSVYSYFHTCLSESVGLQGPRRLGSALFCRLRPLWETLLDRTGRDDDGGGAAEVFLGSFPVVSRDLGFLPIQFRIQILFLPDRPGKAGSCVCRPPFTPRVIVSFLPEPLTWKKSRMEDGEENSHLFIPEMDWSNPSAGEETQYCLQLAVWEDRKERATGKGGNQSGSMWEMEVKSGKDRDRHPEHPSPSVPLLPNSNHLTESHQETQVCSLSSWLVLFCSYAAYVYGSHPSDL